MKGMKRRISWKMRFVAWLLVVAMLSGNLSQVGYAAQAETRETVDQRVIKISEKDIERILNRDPERRPELELKDIPFKGDAKKQDVLDEILSLTEGKILIKKQRNGSSLCLIYVEKDGVDIDFYDEDAIEDEDSCLVDYLEIYTINAGDKAVNYKVELVSDTMVIDEATSSEFQVVGDNEDFVIATDSNAQKATDSNAKPEAEQPETPSAPSEDGQNPSGDVTEQPVAGVESGQEQPTEAGQESGQTPPEEGEKQTEAGEEAGQTPSQDSEKQTEAKEESGQNQPEDSTEAPVAEEEPEQEEPEQEEPEQAPEEEKAEPELTISARPVYLVGDSEEDEGAGLVSLTFGEDTTNKVLADIQQEGGIISRVGANMIKSTRLRLVPATPFFEAVKAALGDPDDPSDNTAVVASVAATPEITGDIKAGEYFKFTVNYAMNAVPLYQYQGGTVSLYTPNEVKNGAIILTVPKALILPKQANYRTESGDQAIYTIPIADGTASGEMVLNAYFDGNGKAAIGTGYEMSSLLDVAYSGVVTAADPTDSSSEVEYTFCDYGQRESRDEEPEEIIYAWTLVSPDRWVVRKEILNKGGIGQQAEAEGQDAVKFEFEITIGLDAQGAPAVGDGEYFRPGRTAFDSYTMTDTLTLYDKEGNPTDIKPIKVELVPEGSGRGAELTAEAPVYGSNVITTQQYATAGHSGNDTGYYRTDENAPALTRYKVTAYYARADFGLDFWDTQIGDGKTYRVDNDVRIDYKLADVNGQAGGADDDQARGYYQFVKGSSKIQLEKDLLIPSLKKNGTLDQKVVPFDAEYGAYYAGYAGFTIEKLDKVSGEYAAYVPKVLENGVYSDLEYIAINPVKDDGDGDVPAQGTNGALTVYVEPGTYRITETVLPDKTAPSAKMTLDIDGQAYFEITVADEGEKTVTFENAVESGGLQFTKKGYDYADHELKSSAKAVAGATFQLLDGDGGIVAEATSDSEGNVSFFPLDAGQYTLKETAVPEGYILDSAEYDVEVKAGEIARPQKNGQPTDVIYNLPNKSSVRVIKWIADPGTGTRVGLSGNATAAYAGRFSVEYRMDDGSWKSYQKNISLNNDGTFILDLPVYMNGKASDAAPTVYRVVELVPDAYTSMSYGTGEFEQTYLQDSLSVVSKEFALAEPGTSADIRTINITNIPRGSIALEKYDAAYAVAGEPGKAVITSSKAGAGQAQFWLLRQDGSRYVEVGNKKTDKNGLVTFSNLDIWDSAGQKIQYFWYEAPQAGKKLEVFEAGYASGAEGMTKTVSGVEIGEKILNNVTVAGPFLLAEGSQTKAYAYNVAQKLPLWVVKKDKGTNAEILWDNNNVDTQFEFAIYQRHAGGTESPNPVVVRNDGKPVYLDMGYRYKVYETKHPASYRGYQNPDTQDSRGYFQEVDLATGSSVGMDSKAQEATGKNVITFVNQRLSRIQVVKKSRSIDLEKLLTVDTLLKNVSFDVYTRERDQFTNTGRTILSDDKDYWVEPGTYYVKERAVPGGHIDPADYLAEGDHTGDNDLRYYRSGKDIYYGPIVVGESGKDVATGSIDVINYKNLGAIRAVKRSGNTREPLGGATIVLEQLIGAEYRQVTTAKSASGTGEVQFNNVPVYDTNGKKITYRLREIAAPDGYTLNNSTVYSVELDPAKLLTKESTDGKLLEFVNNQAVRLTVRKFWTDKWESQFAHRDIKNELPGVDLALYSYKPGDQTAKLVKVSASDLAAAAVSFDGLDSKQMYFVVEGEGAVGYEPVDGKTILTKTGNTYPAELAVTQEGGSYVLAGTYNYVPFPIQEGEAAASLSGEILNERPWVQFNLHKYADKILFNEDGDGREKVEFEYNGENRVFYAGDLQPNKDVNGARFAFYETAPADGLDVDLDGKTPIDIYETGTKLNGLDGQQVEGEFDTTIVRPGNIFWLKEVSAGPGYSWGDRLQVIAFVPEEQIGEFEVDADGFFVRSDGVKVKVVPYGKNTTTSADAFNYDMSGTGEGEIFTAYVKLNKWLETGDEGNKQYTPLGGVTFELRVDGITIATLETGLDNEWGVDEKTGQAMSEMLYFDNILNTLRESGRTEDQISEWVNETERTIRFELVEVKAPDRVEMMDGTRTLEVKFGGSSPVDVSYFWADGDPHEKRLINTMIEGYRVELKVWGYMPTEELFAACDGRITDAKLEQMSGLEVNPLDGVTLNLYRFNYDTNRFERYMQNVTIRTTDGTYVFSDGLPRGRYYLVETNLGNANKNRYFNMYNSTSYYREFTVNASQQNVVNVYNPEKPTLEVSKSVLSGETVDLTGLKLEFRKGNTSAYTRSYPGDSVDGRTVIIEGMESGEYTITESGTPGNTSVKYHGVYNDNKVKIGFNRTKSGSVPQLEKLDKSKAYEFEVTMDLVNPQKGSLTLIKTDAEAPETQLSGAKFRYSYRAFSGSDFSGMGKETYVNREAGKVTDETLIADLAKRSGWSSYSDEYATGADGTLTLSQLDPGWYRFTEIDAPDGYTTYGELFYVAVVADMGQSHTYIETPDTTVTNLHDVTLTVTKLLNYGDLTGHGNAAPDSITFNLYKGIPVEGGINKLGNLGRSVTVNTAAGNREGTIANIPQLTAGEQTSGYRYYLTETAVKANEWVFLGAADGSDHTTALNTVVVNGVTYVELPGFTTKADVKVDVTNRLAKADITLKKVDQGTGAALPGAVFGLYTTDAVEASTGLPLETAKIGSFTDQGNGEYKITNIPATNNAGTKYYIFEVTAPEHYVRKTAPVEVTVLPGQHLTWTQAENAVLLTIQNESGVDISLTKHPDIYGGANADEIQTADVQFDLYVRDTSQAGSSWEKVGDTRRPDADGTIKWTGLKLADRQYALYEYDITDGTYENYALDGVYQGSRKMNTADQGGRTLHVLDGMTAGSAFEFDAYNRPAQEVIIRKEDADGGKAPVAKFQVLAENGDVVKIHGQSLVTTEVVPGADYTEVRIPLKAGSYTLKEIETAANYNLIPDDSRVITEQKIQIPDQANQNTYSFSNLRVDPTVDLDKQVTAVNGESLLEGQEGVLENLWWNDNQTVRYELTPVLGDRITGKGNNATIESFVLTDSGLTMKGPDGNDLAYDVYADGKYSFTALTIPRPTHDSFIVKDGLKVEAGAITATVTAQYFDSTVAEYTHVFDQTSGSWQLELGTDFMVKSFTIAYEDVQMREASGYALGQNFVPGTIEVEAVLRQQTYNPQAIGAISQIRNDASVSVTYSKYLYDGRHEVQALGASGLADVKVLEPDIPTIATSLSVKNNTRPEDTATGNIKVGDTLEYTMTLTNVSGDAIKSDMVGPVFVNRLPAGVTADRNTVIVSWEGSNIEPDEISVVYDGEGNQYLLVSLENSNLKNGENVVITFNAEVTNAVINNTGAATDAMYVTSRLTKDIFANNPGGATFKWQEAAVGTNWPNRYPGINDIAREKLGLWQKENGFTYNYCQNTFNTNSDITLLKEGKGNLDSAFVAEPVNAKVTPDGNGSIIYHLIAKNTSAEANKTVVTKLRLADSLPRLSDVEDFKGVTRGSQWAFNVDAGTDFTVYKTGASGGRTVIDPENYEIYYYTGDGNVAMDQAVLKKYADPAGYGWVQKDNWGGTHPVAVMADITLPDDQPLQTGESIVLEFKADVQEIRTAQELESIAYTYAVNRFSMSYYYESNEQPEKLAFQDVTSNTVQAVLTPARVGVGGRIWIDANGNGIQDDDQYGTSVSDLQKLVAENYFKITLNTTGEENDTVAVASASDALPQVPNEAKKPAGALDRTGQFLFSGLLPAQPHDEAQLYTAEADDGTLNVIRNLLNPGYLKGLNPQTNRLTIATKGDESANIIPGMYLKKTATTVAADGSSNPEGGMSRKPLELIQGKYPGETQDNNFVTNGKANTYVSENFFLWGDTDNWDQTKDFGLIPYRDLTITKYGEGESGDTLAGAEFALYGPFDDEAQAKAFDTAKAGDGSDKFIARRTSQADGTLKFEGLYYYLYYVIVEESTPDDYMTYGAVASSNIRPMSDDQADASWYVPWGVTEASVTNKYGDGTVKVTKADSETGEALTGAQFMLRASATNVDGAWATFLDKVEADMPFGWEGVENVTVESGVLRFTIAGTATGGVSDGTAVLTELPYGTYTLTETKAPDGYILGEKPETRTFTISRNDRSISYTTDKMALENDAMGPIPNTPHKTTVVKVRENYVETKLAGAEFILKTGDGGYVLLKDGSFAGYTRDEENASRFVTDENGTFVIKRLPAGTYTLIEKTAPSGYRINDKIDPFIVDGTGHITVQVEDARISGGGGGGGGGGSTGRRSVTVIDPENVPLAGLPGSPTNDTIILDDEVPLAGLPKTGEIVNAAAGLAAMLSTALMGVYIAMQKKKRPER